MPSAAKLKLVITADGRQARDELKSTGNSVLGLDEKVKAAGESIQNVGTKMLIGGAVLDAAIGASAAMAAKFQEDTVALVHGAGESKSALGQVTQGLLDMAGQVGDTPDHLAQGMYMVESAGYHGAAGLKVMKSAAEGAKIGMADQATVADAVTSALNAYHLSASDAKGVTGQLIQTVASGKMHFQDLAASLGSVLPAAAAAHISLQEVGAAIATMTAQGTPAADATTYLRQTILQLQNPTAKAGKVLKELGFTSTQVADTLTHKGLYAALSLIQEHLSTKFPQGGAKATAALATLVGGTKSMQAALELTGGNLKVFAANIQNVGNEAKGVTKFTEDWALVSTTAAAQFDKMKGQLAAVAIEIGTALLPSLEKLMAAIVPVVKQVGAFAQAHGDLIAKVLLASAAFFTLVGAVLTIAGTIVIALAVLNPVTLIVLGIVGALGLLTAAWLTNVGGIRDAVIPVLQQVSNIFQSQIVPAIQQAIAFVVVNLPLVEATVTNVFNAVLAVVNRVIGIVAPFIVQEMSVVTSWWQANVPLMQQTATTVMNAIQSVINAVMPVLQAIFQTVMPIIAEVWRVEWGAIQGALQLAWTVITTLVDAAIHIVLDTITMVMDLINGNWAGAWQQVQNILLTVWNAIRTIIQAALNFILNSLLTPILNDLGKVWNDAWQGVSDFFVKNWANIVTTAKDSVNSIIGFLDGLISHWDNLDFHIPGFNIQLPSVVVAGQTIGGGSLSWSGLDIKPIQIPPIPVLDTGGIVTGPTLAALSMNSVPEAVVPLQSNGGIVDYNQLAKAIAAELANQPISVNINGQTLAQVTRGEMLRTKTRMPLLGLA